MEGSDQEIFSQSLLADIQKRKQEQREKQSKFRRNFDRKELSPYERKVQIAHLINGTNFVLGELATEFETEGIHAKINPVYNIVKFHKYDRIEQPKIPYKYFLSAEETAYTAYSAFLGHKQKIGEQVVQLNNEKELIEEWRSLEKAMLDCNEVIDDEVYERSLPSDANDFWEQIQKSPADYFDYIRRSRNRDSHTGFVDDPLEQYLFAYYMVPCMRYGLGTGKGESLQEIFSGRSPKTPSKNMAGIA